MNQDGFTLAETLAALVIIGLAVGGLVGGMNLLGRVQTKAVANAAQTDNGTQLESAFTLFLERAGPFRSDDAHGLQGDSGRFSYACGHRACTAKLDRKNGQMILALSGRNGSVRSIDLGAGAYVFDYQDELGQEADWPPPDQGEPRTLRAIGIVKPRLGEVLPVAEARIFAEQPATCAFDSISRTCRVEAAP
jgi:prepilin-type N-terminal cleavage/methylation domain-containing protein